MRFPRTRRTVARTLRNAQTKDFYIYTFLYLIIYLIIIISFRRFLREI